MGFLPTCRALLSGGMAPCGATTTAGFPMRIPRRTAPLRILQIGRSPPLSSNKTTHFKLLRQHTGVPFADMVFFDDCNWGDNCGTVERGCVGVVAQRTPGGLQESEWDECIRRFQAKRAE